MDDKDRMIEYLKKELKRIENQNKLIEKQLNDLYYKQIKGVENGKSNAKQS